MGFKEKYLKYKQKYLELKNTYTYYYVGGGENRKRGTDGENKSSQEILGSLYRVPIKIEGLDFGIVTHQNLSHCIKELIDASYEIYSQLLSVATPDNKFTIICGGQSPSYYCLAMKYFSIFNPCLVNIIVLPHSKNGEKTYGYQQIEENKSYCERLKEKNILLNNNVVIIDGVHSGVGILALESALKQCYRNQKGINFTKIAINASKTVSQIPVDKELILTCEPKFSDTFPRLVTGFYPRHFHSCEKFITDFIDIENNQVALMIINIAVNYPDTQVEDTEWFKLNNIITPEMEKYTLKRDTEIAERKRILDELYQKEKQQKEILQSERNERLKEQIRLGNVSEQNYKPIVLYNEYGKIYQCPICLSKTGTGAPLNPTIKSYFDHYNRLLPCPFDNLVPRENF